MIGSHTGPAGSACIVERDERGGITIERHGRRERFRIYAGCRLGPLGPDHRDPSRLLLAFEAGGAHGAPQDAFVATISPDGLEALARDLLAAVERHRGGRAIDMRFLT